MTTLKYYQCSRCYGKFRIPPNAKEIIHFCAVLGGKKVVIPIKDLKGGD